MTPSKSDLVFIALAIGSGALALMLGGGEAMRAAAGQSVSLIVMVLPLLVGGVLIGGLIGQLVVKDKIATILGARSGMRGLLLASVAGALTPGGPLMVFPLASALWIAGAEAGLLVTYITAWSLLGLVKIIAWELPLLGPEFTLLRVAVCLPLPVIAGLLARHLARSRWFQAMARPEK